MLQSTSSVSSRQNSRRPSPEGSNKSSDTEVSVETLISWLVAAKRSLASIHYVHRATTLLAEARSTIESTAALIARTRYLKRSLHSQLKILRGVQYEVEAGAHTIKQEIHTTIKELENADRKLQTDIDLLKETRIEDAFRARRLDTVTLADTQVEIKDTLHDFVDDQPVEALRQNAQAAHASIQNARHRIDDSIRNLEDDLQRINEVLADRTVTSSSTKSDLEPPDMSKQLRSLETNAREMAQSLESLVQHFDSCVNAIKHTEGGGAAVVKNLTAEDLPEGVNVEALEASTHSMSDQDRTEMLQVLKTDADQVEDVVAEIHERAADMDMQLNRIVNWRESCETSYRDVASAFRLLEKVGDRLPTHIIEVTAFSAHWADERSRIDDCAAGMYELCEMYEKFLAAYDGMIVEAARRRLVRKRMERIVQEAQQQLDELYNGDMQERDRFRSEQGAYLPSDIWHGLNVLPAQFTFQKMNDAGLDSIPELPKEIVANAFERVRAAAAFRETFDP